MTRLIVKRRRILGVLILCLLLSAAFRVDDRAAAAADGAAGLRMKSQQIYPGIRAAIPESFTPMSAEMFILKYGNPSRKTTRAFSDSNSEANIVFELSPQAEDPTLLKERTLRRLQSDPAIRGATASQSTVSGRPAVVFEFESQALDTAVFNILFFIRIGPETMLVGNFNCPAALMPAWKAAGREMLQSVSID